jgi:hypothetical protein
MSTSWPEQLVAEIRKEAEVLRLWGADAQAGAAEAMADRIEGRLEAWRLESLTIAEGSTESGYSEAHLRRLIAGGRVPNRGDRGSPRVRRSDLPKKASRLRSSPGEPDLAGDVLRARGLEQL